MIDILLKKEINGEELEELLRLRKNKKLQFLLVDVREEYEYNVNRIIGVDFLIPLSELHDQVKKIDDKKDVPIIMQCKLGGRSQQAQRQLEIMGFKNVINLAGGITEYKGDIIYGN
jgi:rhodanese-related sulfurtransferase|tara:strand:- start:9571 stop:9918 length:348 start_codon:yes stop_codon:yes gene_type:complete